MSVLAHGHNFLSAVALRPRAAASALAAGCAAVLLAAAGPAEAATPYTAYVANWSAGTVSPINTATDAVGPAIAVGANPAGIAITPDAKTAYVANYGSNSVTQIDTATSTPRASISVGARPASIAITPDGKTAYVANYGSGTVTPIDTATNSAGSPVTVGGAPAAIAITPDGKTAYVTNLSASTVTPITLATNTVGTPIAVGSAPLGIAISPDGKTAFVANSGANTVTPITLGTNTAGAAIAVGAAPVAVAISPDGTSAYVANSGFDTVTPINLATHATAAPITSRNGPRGIAITPDGGSAVVANLGDVGFAANTTSGSTSVTVIGSTARLAQGMTVTGYGIPAGTTIAAPPGANSIKLSQPATASWTGVSLTAWEQSTVTPINLATQTLEAAIGLSTGIDAEPAITPDQAPVASFTAHSAGAGSASSFDASSSTVAYGSITSYAWSFGDGTGASTTSPTTTHTYAVPGTYAVTLTETDSAGTSTAQVFTGQTVSRNGGPGAQATRNLLVSAAPPTPPSSPPVTSTAPGSRRARNASPALVIFAKTLRVTPSGDVFIEVRCPVTALAGCRGRLTLRLLEVPPRRTRAHAARCARGCRTLGSSSYEARVGQTKRIRVHVASFGRKLLRHRKVLHASLVDTNVSGSGTSPTAVPITLRPPRA